MLALLLVFERLTRNESYASVRAPLRHAALITFVSAILSCLAGLLLADDSGYPEQTLERHKWLGIVFTLASGGFYLFLNSHFWKPSRQNAFSVLLILLVGFTGHLGGSLTHGEGYLKEPFLAMFESEPPPRPARKPVNDPKKALVYSDLVEPVLEKKCFQCHNYRKQKGGLRLDLPEKLWKGGKSGVVLVQGHPEESELYKRLILPENDEHRMPPKGKKSLTSTETELIRWWISTGASLDKKLVEIPDHQEIGRLLSSSESENSSHSTETGEPSEFVGISPKPAQPSTFDGIKKAGFRVDLLTPEGNLVSVNSVNRPDPINLGELLPLKSQLVWLRLSGARIQEKGFQDLKEFSNLTRLYLDRTEVGNAEMDQLQKLPHLRILNLVGTRITDEGIRKIAGLHSLRNVYLWQTGVRKETIDQLRQKMPDTDFNLGEEFSSQSTPKPTKKS